MFHGLSSYGNEIHFDAPDKNNFLQAYYMSLIFTKMCDVLTGVTIVVTHSFDNFGTKSFEFSWALSTRSKFPKIPVQNQMEQKISGNSF